MPQVDHTTFFPIAFWTFLLYSAGYLFINTTVLYSFLSSLKLAAKRQAYGFSKSEITRRFTVTSLFFPWVAL